MAIIIKYTAFVIITEVNRIMLLCCTIMPYSIPRIFPINVKTYKLVSQEKYLRLYPKGDVPLNFLYKTVEKKLK